MKRRKKENGMEEKSVISVIVKKLDIIDFIKCRRVSRKYKSIIDGILRSFHWGFWFNFHTNVKLNEEFVSAFIDNFNKTEYWTSVKLSEEFLIRNYTKLIWATNELFKFQKCSEKVLRLYAPKEYYNRIYKEMYFDIFGRNLFNKSILQEYVDSDVRFTEYVELSIVNCNDILFIPNIEYLMKCSKDELKHHVCHTQLPDIILVERAKEIHWELAAKYQKISDYVLYNANLKYEVISRFPDLPYNYIDTNIDKLHWNILSEHHIITHEFMERYINHINYLSLSKNSNLPFSVALKYREKLNIDKIFCKYSNYTPKEIHSLLFFVVKLIEPAPKYSDAKIENK